MNAHLQKLIVLLRWGLALGLGGWLWLRGHPIGAMIFAATVLWGHVLILALEFLMLPAINRGDSAPAAGLRQHLRAWWIESRACSRVFGWQQPFASRREPDHWPANATGRRGVLLVHGFFCNRGLWNDWLVRLRQADVPVMALTLEPAFGSIDRYVADLETAVRELERRTGCAPVLVGHSMGGLAIRAWWRAHGQDTRVHQMLTLGTPHAGTFMARFSVARNAGQMRLGSVWLRNLAAQESAAMRARMRCYYSHTDNIVCPASSATLAGAQQIHLPATGHIGLLYEAQVFDDLMQCLRRPVGL
ncbi:MAG: alpha/beta fold hydrolase [Burkholderiaceae bacterium]|nr:alpha/beta fold hydrolase [Burkholderiaceae bacterium]